MGDLINLHESFRISHKTVQGKEAPPFPDVGTNKQKVKFCGSLMGI
jgi:hypothetical protein